MCFHVLNLCWIKHKKIFECFRCFWKVLCFYKNRKISKTVLPCFGDSVVGHLSRMLQPQARGLFLVTCFSREKCVFCISKTVFKTFSVFPSTFCDCSLSSPFLSQLKLTQTLLKLHFCTIFSPIFKKKVWVFSISLHFPCFEYAFLDSVSVLLPLCFEKYHARSRVCFILVSVHWLRISVFDFITGVYMKFVVCALFHDSVISFISCLWYSVTLFVIWILVMLSAHLILSY